MGTNKTKKNQSENTSGKWKERVDTVIDYTGKVATVVGAVIGAAGAYKQYKNQNNK